MATALSLVHFWKLSCQTFWFLVEAEITQEAGISNISAKEGC